MRIRYIAGDWAANLAAGALIGAVCAAEISPEWSMLPAMAAGMLQGMGIATVLGVFGGILLGAFELMLPLMLTGMLAGMGVAMAASIETFTLARGMLWGLAAGAAAMAYSTALNLYLKGDARIEP